MNIMKATQCYHLFWKQIFLYLALVWVAFLFATFYFLPENYIDDELEQTLAIANQHLDDVHRVNIKLMEMRNDLSQRLRFNEKKVHKSSYFTEQYS